MCHFDNLSLHQIIGLCCLFAFDIFSMLCSAIPFLSRFADKNSFEYEYGVRWKRLYEMYKEKKMLLESDLQAEIDQLERRLAIVKHEHETEKLRQGRCQLQG